MASLVPNPAPAPAPASPTSLEIANSLLATVLNAINATDNSQAAPIIFFPTAGSVTVGLMSVFSVLALLLLLLHMAFVSIIHFYRRYKGGAGERVFVATQFGVYIVSLLIASLLFSIGGAVNFAWVAERSFGAPGNMMCSTQGIVLQFGSLGVAFFVLSITAHTFNTIVLHRRIPRWALWASVITVWGLSVLLDLVGPFVVGENLQTFYVLAGIWCWIPHKFGGSRIGVIVVPILVVSGLCIILNASMFFILRRTMMKSIRNMIGESDTQSTHSALSNGSFSDHNTFFVAKHLVWYPAVYILFSFPLMILVAMGHSDTDGAFIFVSAIYSLMGVAFVVVYLLTHRVFGGQPWRLGVGSMTLQGSRGIKMSNESFVALEKANSPMSPERLKPSTREWTVPKDRTPRESMISTRTAGSKRSNTNRMSMYSAAGSITVPNMPAPPVPTLAADPMPGHRRARSDATLIEGDVPAMDTQSRGIVLRSQQQPLGSAMLRQPSLASLRTGPRPERREEEPPMPISRGVSFKSRVSIIGEPEPQQAPARPTHRPSASTSSVGPLRARTPEMAEFGRVRALKPAHIIPPEEFNISVPHAATVVEEMPSPPSNTMRRKNSMAALAAMDFSEAITRPPSLPPPPPRRQSLVPTLAVSTQVAGLLSAPSPMSMLEAPEAPRPLSDDFQVPSPVMKALMARNAARHGAAESTVGYSASLLAYYDAPSPGLPPPEEQDEDELETEQGHDEDEPIAPGGEIRPSLSAVARPPAHVRMPSASARGPGYL